METINSRPPIYNKQVSDGWGHNIQQGPANPELLARNKAGVFHLVLVNSGHIPSRSSFDLPDVLAWAFISFHFPRKQISFPFSPSSPSLWLRPSLLYVPFSFNL
jgi:hypothetical protein